MEKISEHRIELEGEVLIHPERRKIYEFIRENPNITTRALVSEFKKHRAIILWHLLVLKKFGLIKRTLIVDASNLKLRSPYDIW